MSRFLRGSKREDVPRVDHEGGGGVTFFKGIQKEGGGVKKNPKNQNENLQNPPPDKK